MEEVKKMCRGCALEIETVPDMEHIKPNTPLSLMKSCFPEIKIRRINQENYKLCLECLEKLLECLNFKESVKETEQQYDKYLKELGNLDKMLYCPILKNNNSKTTQRACKGSTSERTQTLKRTDRLKTLKTYVKKTKTDNTLFATKKVNSWLKSDNSQDVDMVDIPLNIDEFLEQIMTEQISNSNCIDMEPNVDEMLEKMIQDDDINEEIGNIQLMEQMEQDEETEANDEEALNTQTQFARSRKKFSKKYKTIITFTPKPTLAFQCNYCEQKFQTKFDVCEHVKTHKHSPKLLEDIDPPPDPYKCEKCSRVCVSAESLKNHSDYFHSLHKPPQPLKVENVSNSFKCIYCSNVFFSLRRFFRHEPDCYEQNGGPSYEGALYPCNYCKKTFAQLRTLRKHEIQHQCSNNNCDKRKLTEAETKPYRCELCLKLFSVEASLKRHVLCHFQEPARYRCKFCDEEFVEKETLESHQETDHPSSLRKYMCEKCSQMFRSPLALKQHIRLKHRAVASSPAKRKLYRNGKGNATTVGVSGSKEANFVSFYRCNTCNVSFTKMVMYKTHILCSHADQLMLCSKCGQKCISRKSLDAHIKARHTTQKRFKCEICQKRFYYKSTMQNHTKSHTGENRFECEWCGKMLRGFSNRKRHERMHTGEKMYVCEHCQKSFVDSFALKCHVLVHTGEKPYACAQCGKLFAHPSSLKKHEKFVHVWYVNQQEEEEKVETELQNTVFD